MARRGRRNSVRDVDKGWKALRRHLPEAKGAYVKVGLPVSEGKKRKEVRGRDGKAAVIDKKLTLALVAWWNEFGTFTKSGAVDIPARSFIRSTHDENLRKLKRLKRILVLKMLDGEMDIKTALGILGQFMKKEIQKKIVNLRTPANDPQTEKRKKSTNPLIDIGQLHQGITYAITIPKKHKSDLPKARPGRDSAK